MTALSVTAEEFLSAYAERSGIPALQLLQAGRVVATCPCGCDDCEGWQLTARDCLQPEDKVSISVEDYAKPEQKRESGQPRCEYCGRFIRWDEGYGPGSRGWWECSKGCGGRR